MSEKALKFKGVKSLLNVGKTSSLGNSPVVTIMGMKRTTSNFLPVAHEGEGNETYVDKVDNLLGDKETRAEFIARKQEGIERRGHMNLIRKKVKEYAKKIDDSEKDNLDDLWKDYFDEDKCVIPGDLCIECPNCSLFGGWNNDSGNKTFSRVRNFDTYSIQTDDECIVTDESVQGMKIGNQVAEDNSDAKSSNFHYYETVKPGIYFPFIIMIEQATLFDIVAYLKAIRWADNHGYGKYSARNGKFQTEIWAVANGHPKFSVLDILEEAKSAEEIKYNEFKAILDFEETALLKDNEEQIDIKVEDKNNKENISTIQELEEKFDEEFKKYFTALINEG